MLTLSLSPSLCCVCSDALPVRSSQTGVSSLNPAAALVGIELNPGSAGGVGDARGSTSSLGHASAPFSALAILVTFDHLGLLELAIGSRVCRRWRDSLSQLQFTSLSIAGHHTRNRLAGLSGLSTLFPSRPRQCLSQLTHLNLPNAHIAAAVELQLPRTLRSFTPYSIASTALNSVGSLIHLQCLHLHFRRQSDRNIRVHASSFMDQLRSCSQLIELAVSHCAFFREDFEAMFQHHPVLSTLRLDDVCTHLGNQDTTMLQALQGATQLTSLSLLRLCGGTLDSNLLHLRHCSSLCELTLECLPPRRERLLSLFMKPNSGLQLTIRLYGNQEPNRAPASERGRARDNNESDSMERPSKSPKFNLISSPNYGVSALGAWSWRRHLFLRSPSSSPTRLSQLYSDRPLASLGNGLRLEVDVARCRVGEPLQFRVLADRFFRCREAITWYGGLPVFAPSFTAHNLPKTHARRIPGSSYVLDGLPLAWMLNRPVLTDTAQLNWAASHVDQLRPDHSSSPFTAVEVQLWSSTPIGYMINTADDGEINNVGIHHVDSGHSRHSSW